MPPTHAKNVNIYLGNLVTLGSAIFSVFPRNNPSKLLYSCSKHTFTRKITEFSWIFGKLSNTGSGHNSNGNPHVVHTDYHITHENHA